MVDEQNNIMSFINFVQTQDWSIKHFFTTTPLKSPFKLKPIGKSIHRVKDTMNILSDSFYKRITIKINNGGVFVRDTELGANIKTKNQYYVQSGQLVVSKIDARNGAFGIVPIEAEKAIITGNFWAYDVDKNQANIKYLVLVFSSNFFVQSWQDCSNGSGNRLYLQENKFLNCKIPFPTLEEQNILVRKYENTLAEAEHCEKEVEHLKASIEEYLFNVLGIQPLREQVQADRLLVFTSLNKLFKWGADYNINAVNPKNIFLSTKYKNVSILNYCEINPTTKYPDSIEDISFIPMECVSDIDGEIAYKKEGKVMSAKGYTRFQDNDVIWAKITPCMQNGKSAVAKKLLNGFAYGSTEYHVFRSFENKALPEYIHCFLRTNRIRKIAQAYFTGSAGQQRVGSDFLEQLTLPLLPVSSTKNMLSQVEIVDHITEIKDQIKTLRKKVENLRERAKKEFEEAVFSQ
ncbi:MAG: restriction endonuclease subunit S [Anaerovoracaceae bacterium]